MILAHTDKQHNNTHSEPLSPAHQRMLFDESAISPDVAAARGYRTITNRADVPAAFPDWQRRRGLLVPTHSPDGKTVRHQLRPDKPITRKNGSTPKYETPHGSRITLDVNPLMLEEVRHGEAPLWITEGCKKVDALTSQDLPTVGIAGVWNFAEPGSKSKTPLPCWDHIVLDGRRVIVVYDADARTNPDVQEALRRLVAMLEEKGAAVLVAYLPAVNGDGRAGVDDYLAAGGTVADLRAMAAPYRAVDVGAERMSRDELLRAGVSELLASWQELPSTRPGECSARDVVLKLIEAAPAGGKVVADGIRVVKAWGTLMLEAKVSRQTLAKALARLEEHGFLYRDNKGRERDKAGAFVLRAGVDHYGRKQGRREGKADSSLTESGHRGLHPRAPRLMWSSPRWKPSRKAIEEHRRGLRAWLGEPRDGITRLGKIRGAVIDFLYLAGGSATLQEIADFLDRKRARDLTRRKTSERGRDGLLVWLIDAGIIALDGDLASLTPEWLDALNEQRASCGEIEAEEKNRRDLARRRDAFHSRRSGARRTHTKPSTPPASIEAVERGRERRAVELMARAGDVAELTPLPAPEPEIVEALAKALVRWPDHRDDYASWWASTLYVEDYLPAKPTREAVEAALAELSVRQSGATAA